MGKLDAAFLFQFVEEAFPEWIKDPRFKQQLELYKRDFPSE
jgi:hypothetical protein